MWAEKWLNGIKLVKITIFGIKKVSNSKEPPFRLISYYFRITPCYRFGRALSTTAQSCTNCTHSIANTFTFIGSYAGFRKKPFSLEILR